MLAFSKLSPIFCKSTWESGGVGFMTNIPSLDVTKSLRRGSVRHELVLQQLLDRPTVPKGWALNQMLLRRETHCGLICIAAAFQAIFCQHLPSPSSDRVHSQPFNRIDLQRKDRCAPNQETKRACKELFLLFAYAQIFQT